MTIVGGSPYGPGWAESWQLTEATRRRHLWRDLAALDPGI